MKWISLVLIVLVFTVSCKQTTKVEPAPIRVDVEIIEEEPVEEELVHDHMASQPVGEAYPIAGAKRVFTVKINQSNYTQLQIEKLKKAEVIIAKAMNDEEFKKQMLVQQFTYTTKNSTEVWESLFIGAEALMPAKNYQMDLNVQMYYKRNSTVGYTYPNIMTVYTNSKFHDTMDECGVAGNLFHEWTHKMGYDHKNASDSKSVPYTAGRLMKEYCQKNK